MITTQLEFDTMLNALRNEEYEFTAQKRAELEEIEQRRIEARKVFDDYHTQYKNICKELEQKQKELKAVHADFSERRRALSKAFPKAYGQRMPHNEGMTKQRMYGIRAGLIKSLKEHCADYNNINAEGIDVHFNIEGDTIVFSAILPTKECKTE